jgi:aminomethyltransferase
MLMRTPLFEAHQALGARLVPFAGWEMPVQYSGIVDEHRAVRTDVGAFDVSHMGEVWFHGPRAAEALQRLVTNDLGKIVDYQSMYTVMCYPDGGIVDDCIVYRSNAEDFLIVVNASNRAKDFAWMQEQTAGVAAPIDISDETALVAVQGPRAVALLSELAGEDLGARIAPKRWGFANVVGVRVSLARTGYTGEDGFEVFIPGSKARAVWDAIIGAGAKPCGLGARDTLRLEARLSLYGNDIDQTTTPLEAGLGWAVKFDKGEFIGKAALEKQKAEGIPKKLIGFKVAGRGIARHDYPILDAAGAPVGKVTSGTTAPTLGYPIGLGYVPTPLAEASLQVDCRGKVFPIELVSGPFYRRSK